MGFSELPMPEFACPQCKTHSNLGWITEEAFECEHCGEQYDPNTGRAYTEEDFNQTCVTDCPMEGSGWAKEVNAHLGCGKCEYQFDCVLSWCWGCVTREDCLQALQIEMGWEV